MSKKSDWVSASDVGRAEFCPKYLELKYSGAAVSETEEKARARGDAAHEQFNNEIKSTDSRCFIASHLYGINDPRVSFPSSAQLVEWIKRQDKHGRKAVLRGK